MNVEFFTTPKCERLNHLLSVPIHTNFVFAFFAFLRFRGQSAKKKTCLRFAIFNFSEKLQNIFEIGLRKCELIVQKSLLKKKYFEIKNSETPFSCLYAKLATVKIWEQSNKFPLTCSSLKCPLLVKKLFQENSAEKIFLLRKETPAHKHSQLGSQITKPISAWKVYFRWLPGEISPRNLQSTLSVSHCALKNIFGCLFFFLKLLEQNVEDNKGNNL